MAEFTRADRSLLIRAGGHLRAAAREEFERHGADWSASAQAVQAKARHDRLLRDERDLEALRRRLEAQVVPSPGPPAT